MASPAALWARRRELGTLWWRGLGAAGLSRDRFHALPRWQQRLGKVALAGVAGVLYALFVTNVQFDTGFRIGLFAFTAAVLGGIGNLPGAVLGALCIGFIQAFNEGLRWHTPGSDWTQSIVFTILILILVFRPEGLLGERTPEGA